ncbi:MAG: tRNA (adenosine(37)-N6)-threonylcarbamoyltransferase complex dimerization subunit type 1 TsaB [Acidimicrobiales bacterium]
MRHVFETTSVEETEALGERLGRSIRPGMVVALCGELGAGKTALVRGIGRTLAAKGAMTSPTFLTIKPHQSTVGVLYHCDLYRVNEPGYLSAQGVLDDVVEGRGIALVEWAEHMGEDEVAPLGDALVWVRITRGEDEVESRDGEDWDAVGPSTRRIVIESEMVLASEVPNDARGSGERPLRGLLIDTSGPRIVVGLSTEGVLEWLGVREGERHVEEIGSLVQEALSETTLTLGECDYLGVVTGPGGFSGLRVGVSFASVLASLEGLPVVALSSLEILARSALEGHVGGSVQVAIAVSDAKRHEVFYAVFEAASMKLLAEGHCLPSELSERMLAETGLAHDGLAGIALGSGLERYGEDVVLPDGIRRVGFEIAQVMATAARFAYHAARRGEIVSPELLEVHYLRGADATPNTRSLIGGGGPT